MRKVRKPKRNKKDGLVKEMNPVMEAKIDTIFDQWRQGVCPGGQVLIRRGSEIIYDKCFGYANLEHKLPVTGDNVFHVASVSKQITVMCILLLQEDGKLAIDDDIREYIGDLVAFQEPVSIRNLMNNVSGIRDQWELLMIQGVRIDDTITQEDAKGVIRSQTDLNFPPLSRYMYSNSNFTLLAEIVERVAGQTLNDFAKERIFGLLGMEHTCFKDRYWQIVSNRADSYRPNGTEFVHAVLNYGTYGATSLNTTATDFMKWMENLKTPVICKQETLQLLFAYPILSDGTISHYAGGLSVDDPNQHAGRPFISHGGADAGFRSYIVRMTEDDLDIVLFSNTENIQLEVAAEKIAAIVMGYEEETNQEVVDMPDFYTEDFDENDAPGKYYTKGDAPILADIVKKDGQLYMLQEYGAVLLVHKYGNCFEVGPFEYEVFLGKQAGMRYGARDIPFEKWRPTSKSREELDRYTGKYRCTELETTYEVIEENGLLCLSHRRNGKHPLVQTADDEFITGGGENLVALRLTFTRGADGTGKGFELSTGRVKNIAFSRQDLFSCVES
ncbi:hypothetical protein C7R93_03315 [Brevibacillus fortis]|uniref:Beta-lactamase-related domain-containing protein n=2 Tax=Brevibacillus fortis TaxID=2126352 RepID=A0A2P7VKG5_9BACL|nr:hypothetical protein C7R93_03315 [Brevibacillus fortis]